MPQSTNQTELETVPAANVEMQPVEKTPTKKGHGNEKTPIERVASATPSISPEIDLKNLNLDSDEAITLDEAEIFLRQHNISHSRLAELLEDEQACRKLRRQVDWRLMPLLCGTYLLQYIDKQSLSYSAIFDLFTSTGITSDEYSWLASIFYFAYLVAEWPSSYAAQHLPTGTVISVYVILWGVVMACTAASKNFAGFAVCRFFLGALEAVITPAFMLIVSQWYTRAEQPARAGLFYCFNGFGAATGGILFFGVGQAKGWDVWRIMYLLCGGVTIVWGIVLFFFLPNSILSPHGMAKGFSVEQRATLIARTSLQTSSTTRAGVLNRKVKPAQITEALCDPQVWLLFFYVLLNEVVNGGIANFAKLIIKGFTHDALLTTVYGIPGGFCNALFMFTGPYVASRFKNCRTIVMMLWLLPTLIAVILFWKLPRSNNGGLLAGYYISASFVGALVVALQMPASNVGGYTKRVTSTAFVFLAYCAGNIIGPHAFLGNEAPIYQTGCKTIIGCVCGQFVTAVALRILLIRRNRQRDAALAAMPEGEREFSDDVLVDVTDFQDPRFRYAY